MALKINKTMNYCGKHILFESCYAQILDYAGNKDTANISVVIYDNSNKENIIDKIPYTFKLDTSDVAVNIIKQGYEYLKTLEEYKDAVDLLDEGQTA